MASDIDIRHLTSPKIFLIGMTSFLVIVGFVALMLYKPIAIAFRRQSRPQQPDLRRAGAGLGVRVPAGVPAVPRDRLGQFAGVARPRPRPPPLLLAPMATLLNAGAGARGLSTTTTRAILDSVGTRLDEGRELNRYLVGLLVFLGLLGTFWGLLQTVHSIGAVIDSMHGGGGNANMFEDLKSGLAGAAGRHERVVHLLAVRPRRLADPRLPRFAGGAGAEPVLHRA